MLDRKAAAAHQLAVQEIIYLELMHFTSCNKHFHNVINNLHPPPLTHALISQ